MTRSIIFLFLATLFAGHSHGAENPCDPNRTVNVRFDFYDETGKKLTYPEVLEVMTNKKAPLVSDGTFDLDNLKVITIGTSDVENGNWSTPFECLDRHPRQGLMVHWKTENTGFSSFLLDNEGRGFTKSNPQNFNVRLALDARRQLSASRQRRPEFKPSADYLLREEKINRCFADLEKIAGESERAKASYPCLDLVSVTMLQLLKEEGKQRAAKITNAKWGVTIKPTPEIPLEDDYKKVDDLVALFDAPHRWARIYMTGEETDDELVRLRDVVNYATAKGVQLMGQLFDSSSSVRFSVEAFKERVTKYLAYPDFDKFAAWEVGNEVNGGWTGKDMGQKIALAAAAVKEKFPNKIVLLTYYWYSMQDEVPTSLFNWIETNIPPSTAKNIDWMGLSLYVDQQPLGFSWDLVINQLTKIYPGKEIIVGEMDVLDPNQPSYFREGTRRATDEELTHQFIENRYAASFSGSQSFGGGFWWYYDAQMVGKTAKWQVLRKLYCSIYSNCPENGKK